MCDDKYFKFIKNDLLFQYSLFVKSIDQVCILFENKMPLHFQSRSQFASKYGKIFAQYLPFLHFLSVWYWTFIGKVNTFLDGFHHGFIRTVKDVLNSLKKVNRKWTYFRTLESHIGNVKNKVVSVIRGCIKGNGTFWQVYQSLTFASRWSR